MHSKLHLITKCYFFGSKKLSFNTAASNVGRLITKCLDTWQELNGGKKIPIRLGGYLE